MQFKCFFLLPFCSLRWQAFHMKNKFTFFLGSTSYWQTIMFSEITFRISNTKLCLENLVLIPILDIVGLLINIGILLSTTSTTIFLFVFPMITGILKIHALISTPSPNLHKDLPGTSVTIRLFSPLYLNTVHTDPSIPFLPVFVHALSKIHFTRDSTNKFSVSQLTLSVINVMWVFSIFYCRHDDTNCFIDSHSWLLITFPSESIRFEENFPLPFSE